MISDTSPVQFPCPWAAEWGEDMYGLWQAFIYKNIRYVFRWIKSGEFIMGSPENESGRIQEAGSWYGLETQHQVILTDGFWLGETVVTQALWHVVMGDNPSRFKESSDTPVERVSWNDSHEFIQKLSKILHSEALSPFDLESLTLRLPFEAEWEYACRAGTKTAFNFGEEVNLEQANYSGIFDKAGYHKEALQRTSPVRSYPCNNWGLYEMHGNVWEWCGDRYQEDLGEVSVMNPIGAEAGTHRVLRGGSWNDYGGDVRSAVRFHLLPDFRLHSFGLRLALGQSSNSLKNKAV